MNYRSIFRSVLADLENTESSVNMTHEFPKGTKNQITLIPNDNDLEGINSLTAGFKSWLRLRGLKAEVNGATITIVGPQEGFEIYPKHGAAVRKSSINSLTIILHSRIKGANLRASQVIMLPEEDGKPSKAYNLTVKAYQPYLGWINITLMKSPSKFKHMTRKLAKLHEELGITL